jgi:light-regulated signal transduction histidine kinase (bacteriophytochrome)
MVRLNNKKIFDEILDPSEIKILNAIQELVAIYDTNQKILWANQASAKSVNLEPSDMIGKHCYEFWEMQNKACEGCPVQKTLKSGKKEKIIRKSKDNRIWDLISYPIWNKDDEIIGAIEIGRDITEKSKIEENLKKSELKYRKAFNHLNFYEDLFHHDLNNIFQSLLSSIELSQLFTQTNKLNKLDNVLRLAKNQIIRGRLLISNVQSLTDLDKKEPILEAVNLNKFVDLSIDFVKNIYKNKNVSIEIQGVKESIFVYANKGLKDIFVNILRNSVEYNKREAIKIDIIISFVIKDDKRFVKLQILDNGPGIHEDLKKSIIRYINGEIQSKKRFGLGFILIKRILDSYGAKILIRNKLENDPSKGTNITILIPLHKQ